MRFANDTELFNRMEKLFYAAALSDVLDEMGYRDRVIDPALGIRPLRDTFVVAGRACTLVNAPDRRKDEPYDLVIKAIDQLGRDSVIVTTWTRSVLSPGIMGELTATAMRARKSRGAVVNGFTRDGRKLLSMNFPTFARGISPIDTTGRARVVDCGCPITVGGVRIRPGEIVFADADGIVIIPRKIEEEAIARTFHRVTTENKVRKHLKAGGTMANAWKKYRVL